MKLSIFPRSKIGQGYVLLIVMVMMAISLIIVTGLSGYSTANAKLNQRNIDYYLTLSASEAATEKVLTAMTSDFRDFGDAYVVARLDNYRKLRPKATESTEWGSFDFMNLAGQKDRVEIQYTSIPGFSPLGGAYATMCANKDRFRILSNAQSQNSVDGVVATVYQDIELGRIPIFQYAIFYNVPLEIEPGADMIITGPVHGNTNIVLSPGAILTFNSALTASGTISTSGSGTINYNPLYPPVSGASVLSLPIGTNNTPAAVQEVIMVPPAAENPLSSMGQQRYYNKADIIILVSNSNVTAKSGYWNNFATSIPTNEVATFVTTTNQFYNKREAKTIKVIDIDVAKLVQYNLTNAALRPYLPLTDIRVVYVADYRTVLIGAESGVRVSNGTNLPPQGLTVATAQPLYVQGDYNVTPLGKGTTNTSGTLPASFAADAITVLSTAWKDTNAINVLAKPLSGRVAADTTVNAAFLMGDVATVGVNYSGGVENFPRFLENWSGRTFTYNGSMVCMFFSKIATGTWLGTGTTYDIYNPPVRKWSLDQNYSTSSKLPPGTPNLAVLNRAAWRTPAAYSTNVMAGF